MPKNQEFVKSRVNTKSTLIKRQETMRAMRSLQTDCNTKFDRLEKWILGISSRLPTYSKTYSKTYVSTLVFASVLIFLVKSGLQEETPQNCCATRTYVAFVSTTLLYCCATTLLYCCVGVLFTHGGVTGGCLWCLGAFLSQALLYAAVNLVPH